jgi:hypothetical protein
VVIGMLASCSNSASPDLPAGGESNVKFTTAGRGRITARFTRP